MNGTDKGYRCRLAAWRADRQMLIQPYFAESDRKFTTREVLCSEMIALHHSGNERAINVAKRLGLIVRGIANSGASRYCRCFVGMELSSQLHVQTGFFFITQ